MMFHFDAFLETLPIMAKGMAGIFLVTVVIILCIALLNFLFSDKKKKEDSDKK